ncbi:Cro/CI family transcriptional regulator [Xenorhabdus bovienii]|uniref:Cro/CI family transcriptional regulator n=1 Tax=Xenorhabdus bovienii TaxID=40576 RepID=UPI0023B25833|nr:Cro/CI family transcriptional regulator [Xenorhabdus bovienii]MDE9467509.1 Cro/Cl family transcriptional regulator [Xenorhabdus bovienii]
MKKNEVLRYFNTVNSVAKAIGITSSAVSQWSQTIPERAALRIEKITNGALKYDAELYKKKTCINSTT